MKFLCLAYGDEAGWKTLTDREREDALACDAEIRARGDFVTALRPGVTSVRNWDRNLIVTNERCASRDLPLAGFSVIEAGSIDEVVGLVAGTPCARARGVIEIRPFWDLDGDA